MSLRDKVRGAVAGFNKGYGSITNSGSNALPPLVIGRDGWRDQDKENPGAGAVPAVYRSVTIGADMLASSPISLYQDQPTGGSIIVTGTDVSRTINFELSYPDLEKAFYDMLLLGNGFLLKHYNERGGLSDIEALSYEDIEINADDNGKLFYKRFANAALGRKEVVFPATKMIHLKYRSVTRDQVWGEAPTATCSPTIPMLFSLRELVKKTMANQGQPSGVLETEAILDEAVVGRLRAQWDNLFATMGSKTGGTPVLEQGVSYKPHTIHPIDESLVSFSNFGVREVARIYGIPPSLLGLESEMSYNSAVEAARAFVTNFLTPLAKRVEDTFSRALLTREERHSGQRVGIDLTALVRGNGSELYESLSRGVNSGFITANEARSTIGLSERDDGNELRIPVSTAPHEIWSDPTSKTPQIAAPAAPDAPPEKCFLPVVPALPKTPATLKGII